jgi:hypothetical protein
MEDKVEEGGEGEQLLPFPSSIRRKREKRRGEERRGGESLHWVYKTSIHLLGQLAGSEKRGNKGGRGNKYLAKWERDRQSHPIGLKGAIWHLNNGNNRRSRIIDIGIISPLGEYLVVRKKREEWGTFCCRLPPVLIHCPYQSK